MGLFKKKNKNLIASQMLQGGEIVGLKEAGEIAVGSILELDVASSAFFMYLDKITDNFVFNDGAENKLSLTYTTLPLTTRALSKKLSTDANKPDKTILADLYVLNLAPINYVALESYTILLDDIKYKKLKLKVLFDADIKITDARKVLECLRTEQGLIRGGYAKPAIASWVRECVRRCIETANLPVTLLKFKQEDATNLIKEKLTYELSKLGLNLTKFILTGTRINKKFDKVLEIEKTAAFNAGQNIQNLTSENNSEIVLKKVGANASGDKDIEVTEISANKLKDKKTILNIETGSKNIQDVKLTDEKIVNPNLDELFKNESIKSEIGLQPVGNYFSKVNEIIDKYEDKPKEIIENKKPVWKTSGQENNTWKSKTTAQENNTWKSKTTGEKFYTVNLSDDEDDYFDDKTVSEEEDTKPDVATKQANKFCTGCGAVAREGDLFCGKCGKKLN